MTVTRQLNERDKILNTQWGPERSVEVPKPSDSTLGLNIVSGKVEIVDVDGGTSDDIQGIFISHVMAESPAGITGRLKVISEQAGDHIVEINGVCVRNSTYDNAIKLLKSSQNRVELVVQSFIYPEHTMTANTEVESSQHSHTMMNKEVSRSIDRSHHNGPDNGESIQNKMSESNLNQNIEISTDRRQSSIQKNESEESSDDEDERHLEGNILTSAGFEISRKSAGNIKRSAAEISADPEDEDDFGYTLQKIKKKYYNLGGEVIFTHLSKDGHDIGLALSGHKDRLVMGVFICGINPKGIAFQNENIKVGDEIIEVNGHVFRGKCHLNASSAIKKMPTLILKIILIRRPDNSNLAVRPITHFPTLIDDKDQYSQFNDVRTITIQKGQYGLGIMIVEGKHARVGQGIFASDIQEGSLAEKAGLQVGDMILGVNSDTLLGVTQSDATNLLKGAEGLVILTVCNPNKSGKEQPKTDDNTSGGPADSATKSNNSQSNTKMGTADKSEQSSDAKTPKAAEVKPMNTELQISDSSMVKFNIIGGADTPSAGVFINDIFSDNVPNASVPLKCGDQILEFGPENFKSIDFQAAQTVLLSTLGNIKIVFLRDESAVEEIEVELQAKPGKGIGVCITEFKSGKGVYISELMPDGSAAESGKLAIGDRIISISGQDVRELSGDDTAVLLKASSSILLRIARYKVHRVSA